MPAPYQNPAMASYPTPSPQDVDTGLVCLLILAWYFGLVADGEQLRHEFGLSGKSQSTRREGEVVISASRSWGGL